MALLLLRLRLDADPQLSSPCSRVSFGEWPWVHWSESAPPMEGLGEDSTYSYESLGL